MQRASLGLWPSIVRLLSSRLAWSARFGALFVVALAAACGQSPTAPTPSASQTTAPVPTATVTQSAPPPGATATSTGVPTYPPGTTVGIPAVDQLIPRILTEDDAFILDLLAYVEAPCTDEPSTLFEPACPPGVSAGTSIEVFPRSSCESTLEPKWIIADVVAGFTMPDLKLFSVYHVDPASNESGDIGIVFVGTFPGSPPSGPAMYSYVLNNAGNIVRWQSSCDVIDPYEYVEARSVSSYVLPPLR